MAVNDQIADMLTRIRNAANAKFETVVVPHSKVKEAVARAIAAEGFLGSVDVEGEGIRRSIVIGIRYTDDGAPVFNELKRLSKLGRRVYIQAKEIRPNRQGFGVAILTTSRGIMRDTDARRQGLGGEVLCTVW